MHTYPVLLTHIAEIADEPLVLDPNDPDAETRTNTWSLSSLPGERATLPVDQVVAASAVMPESVSELIRSASLITAGVMPCLPFRERGAS